MNRCTTLDPQPRTVGRGTRRQPRHFTVAGRCLAAVLAIAGLCSCKSELYERLDERDANEMLATLYSAGIHADKSTRDEKTWSVEVDEHDLANGLRVIAEHGLPREQFANAGELFKKEGLVSTPSEERIRYIYAVSQELSNTLSQIDGVIVARVHPVIPANDPLASQIRPSSASVFIKYRRDTNLESLAPVIKNLVMKSIEGLEYENIALTFVAAQEFPRDKTASPLSPGDGPVKAVIGGSGTLLLFVLAGLGYIRHRYRMDRAALVTGGAPAAAGKPPLTPQVR
jgi:type III secretion protein J